MFKQISRLGLEAEGRYARPEELQFIEDYLITAELRISAYQKIRDKETEILEQIANRMREIEPNIFSINHRDFSSVCQRDTKLLIRCSSLAMLLDDLDRLQKSLLLWQRTIIKAIDHRHQAQIAQQVIPEVIKQFLTPEETELMMPVWYLMRAILIS